MKMPTAHGSGRRSPAPSRTASMPRNASWPRWLPFTAIGLVLGCSEERPDWMAPPPVDPPAILQAIMDQADTDKNGNLAGKELAIIPALQVSLGPLDTDSDKKLSRDEINAWLERLKTYGYPQQQAPFSIRFRGKPLAKARVKIVPEPCMGGTIEPSEGTTDASGLVWVKVENPKIPGARCGLYRIEITGKGPDGKPIPPKYGKDSPLGAAIGGDLPTSWTPVVNLE